LLPRRVNTVGETALLLNLLPNTIKTRRGRETIVIDRKRPRCSKEQRGQIL
jgi:hypothetical protein